MFKRRKPDDPTAPDDRLPSPGSGEPATREPSRDFGHDSGLGVPPFRPATLPTPKESSMGRSPYATPNVQPPNTASLPGRGGQMGAPISGQMAVPPGGLPARGALPEPVERRMLVVGRGISLQGTVQDAERLVVEGTVEASMIHATELAVASGGVFKGEVEVEDAEVAGTIDGTLTVRGNLVVRATGRVLGTARCRRLQVEDGGQITGRIEMITENTRAIAAPIAAQE